MAGLPQWVRQYSRKAETYTLNWHSRVLSADSKPEHESSVTGLKWEKRTWEVHKREHTWGVRASTWEHTNEKTHTRAQTRTRASTHMWAHNKYDSIQIANMWKHMHMEDAHIRAHIQDEWSLWKCLRQAGNPRHANRAQLRKYILKLKYSIIEKEFTLSWYLSKATKNRKKLLSFGSSSAV